MWRKLPTSTPMNYLNLQKKLTKGNFQSIIIGNLRFLEVKREHLEHIRVVMTKTDETQ